MFAFRSFLLIQFLLRNLQWDFLMKNSFFLPISLVILCYWYASFTWHRSKMLHSAFSRADMGDVLRAIRDIGQCLQSKSRIEFQMYANALRFRSDLSYCKKIKRFLVWFDHNMSLVDMRILSQNAAYIWLISSFACFILTQCNADRYLTCISKYLQVFRFQCECQRVDRFTFDCIGSSLCHSIVLSLLPLQKFTKSPYKLSLVQCTTNANT